MWEKFLEKESFDEKEIAFVIKNKRTAPKELLVRLGLVESEVQIESEEEKPKTKKK